MQAFASEFLKHARRYLEAQYEEGFTLPGTFRPSSVSGRGRLPWFPLSKLYICRVNLGPYLLGSLLTLPSPFSSKRILSSVGALAALKLWKASNSDWLLSSPHLWRSTRKEVRDLRATFRQCGYACLKHEVDSNSTVRCKWQNSK
jgi:hypothetical protein